MMKKTRMWFVWLFLFCIYCSFSLLSQTSSQGPFDPGGGINGDGEGGGDVGEDYLGVDILMQPNKCSTREEGVIIVHSYEGNFHLRSIQRKAKDLWLEGKKFKHIFVLFSSREVDMEEGRQEWEEHKDILLGDKVEGYRVLAYKHLAGLRWVNQKCGQVDTVIKMDDDIFVNFEQLLPKGKVSRQVRKKCLTFLLFSPFSEAECFSSLPSVHGRHAPDIPSYPEKQVD